MSDLAAHLDTLARSGALGVFRANAAGEILETNDAFLTMLGLGPAAAGSLSFGALTGPEQVACDAEMIRRLAAGEPAPPWETELFAADASLVPVLMGGTGLEGTAGEWVGFAVDLRARERRRAVRELAAHPPEESRTNVMDRDGILLYLEQELPRARREGNPLAVILAGVDRFEAVRRSVGDAAAQELFWAAVDRTKLGLRGYDGLGRFGDGEFVIVLPECELGGVLAVAKRMQAAVAREPFHAGEIPVILTISAGAVTTEERGDCTAADLMQAADAALMRARNRGGSRVELATA